MMTLTVVQLMMTLAVMMTLTVVQLMMTLAVMMTCLSVLQAG